MRIKIIIFLLLGTFVAQAQVDLNTAREMYFSMDKDQCNSLKLSNLFDEQPPKDPLLNAYYGASTAASPACVSNPARKIANFRKGKQLLDNAAQNSPYNLEIRFLRFATQSKAPAFLGYNTHLNEDKKFILNHLPAFRNIKGNEQTAKRIAAFMLDSEQLTANEKAGIKTLSN